MIENIIVTDDGKVYGTLKYVTDYDGFNPLENEGYFFPFNLEKEGTTMTFIKNNIPSKTGIDWEKENVFKVEKNQVWKVKVDNEDVLTLDFSTATFEE